MTITIGFHDLRSPKQMVESRRRANHNSHKNGCKGTIRELPKPLIVRLREKRESQRRRREAE